MFVVSALQGCRSSPDEAAERATRARQMRDVSRMLDAMETPGHAPVPTLARIAASPAAPPARPDEGGGTFHRTTAWVLASIASAIVIVGAIVRRRRRRTPRSHVAETPPIRTPAPTWVYQSSPFETPLVHHVDQPVDLLLPATDIVTPIDDAPMPTPTGHTLLMRLEAIDASPALHLVGDRDFPDLRRVGDGIAALDAWKDTLQRVAGDDNDDARLARWLLPALLVLRSRELPRRDAERLLDEAALLARNGIDHAADDTRGHWVGRAIRIELARIERLSGATRLFALRALQARQGLDLAADNVPAIDAWIDVQLTWASWLLGGGASARHVEAETLCDTLAGLGPAASALALRRRAEIFMRRAETEKTSRRLAYLERAQALFNDAYAHGADPGTALMLARCARLRAMTLPPAEAADACATALTHAFVAEQHPAWRLDALECRLAIQLTYEALPGRAVQGEVAASLGRELAAMDAHSVGARMAMAATRLREGDFAGASALCEAAWRGGGADACVLQLWRDACRGWTDTADSTGHDRHALAHAVRQLAIARATL